jgi:hypothetical protein
MQEHIIKLNLFPSNLDLNQRNLTENTNLGSFSLVEDAAQLNDYYPCRKIYRGD